ncbi:MAG: LamG domain-containing protein, partial [Candidatus Aenigmarchaeota archaeon]|nr:LamG domain-containing protein [Candidatus Aenigmarchaeota archaeon]
MNKKQIKFLTLFFAFLFIAPIYASDPYLVAEWHFDECSGNILHDSSGNGNDGTIHGDATWTEGIIGNALSFDGVGDYVTIPINSSSLLNINGTQITQSAWIYALSSVTHGTIATRNGAYYFQRDDNGKLASYLYGTTPETYMYSDSTIPLNHWSFVAYTYNGSELRFYIDGKTSGIIQLTGNITPLFNKEPFRIGWDNFKTERYFHGKIDEVRIYNRALSDEEIKAHYDAIMHPASAYPNATKNAIIITRSSDWRDLVHAQSTGRQVIFTETITDKIKNEIAASNTDQIWLLGDIQNKEDINATQITSCDHIP